MALTHHALLYMALTHHALLCVALTHHALLYMALTHHVHDTGTTACIALPNQSPPTLAQRWLYAAEPNQSAQHVAWETGSAFGVCSLHSYMTFVNGLQVNTTMLRKPYLPFVVCYLFTGATSVP